jgi:RNA polymerase sigma-70 factor (ECF subfamily)
LFLKGHSISSPNFAFDDFFVNSVNKIKLVVRDSDMKEMGTNSELNLEFDAINNAVMEELFKTHYLQLCNYAYIFLKDTDECEDVVQAVFYQLWEKKDSTEITTSFKSYLFAAVRNRCLKRISHLKVRDEYKANAIHVNHKNADNTMDRLLGKELEDQIKDAIENLPEQCRLVFTLNRQSGFKYAEIAAHLKISPKTVENQMGKALKVLREKLKGYLIPML